jgi:hypothetical protein
LVHVEAFPANVEAPRELAFRVAGPRRPALRVEIAEGRRLRVAGRTPALWARVDPGWYGATALLGDAPRVLPPFRAAEARAPRRGWLWELLERLVASPESPLYEGEHALVPWTVERNVDHWTGVCRATLASVFWIDAQTVPVVPLRPLPPTDDARVKLFRKLARDGRLPPVVLQRVSGLSATIVVDGHARLTAALEAGGPVPALCLMPAIVTAAPDPHENRPVFEQVYESMAAEGRDLVGANAALSDLYTRRPVARPTRAWPIAGGAAGWDAEVRARAAARGVDAADLLR